MATDNRTRSLLISLQEKDLKRAAAIPPLATVWARRAKTKYDDLVHGTDRSVRAVKISLLRDPGAFADDLLNFWHGVIKTEIELTADAPDIDPLSYGARRAAHDFGGPLARTFLAALAASDLDVAAEASARYDELVLLADSPLPNPDLFCDCDVEEHTHRPDVVELQATAKALREQGEDLARRLRDAADLIADGRPASALELDADEWSAAVRLLLDTAAEFDQPNCLTNLEDRLREIAEEAEQRTEAAVNALKTIEMLNSQGLEVMVPEALTRLGFAKEDEVRRIAAAPDVKHPIAGGPETPDIVKVEHIPADETQPAEADGADEPPQEAPVLTSDLPATDDSDDPPHLPEQQSIGVPRPHESLQTPHTILTGLTDEGNQSAQTVHGSDISVVVPKEDNADAEDEPVSSSAAISTSPDAGDPALSRAAADEPTLNQAQLPDFPWDEGRPPLIGELILQNRYALAYHVAVASGESGTRQQLLKLACAAALCPAAALEMGLSQLIPAEAEIDHLDTNEVRVLLAAALRAGLVLGYAPLGLSSLVERAELAGTGFYELAGVLAALTQRGYRRDAENVAHGDEDLAGRWTELGAEASALLEGLGRKNTTYQRSSKVLHHLVRAAEPVGYALATAAALVERGVDGASDAQWATLEGTTEQLLDNNGCERLVNDADRQVSSAQQRKEPITGRAKTQLRDSLGQAGELLNRLLVIRRAILATEDLVSISSVHDLTRALADAPNEHSARSVGEAALVSLLTWLRSEPGEPRAASVETALDRGLVGLFDLPRDEDDVPLASQRRPRWRR